MNGGFFPDWNLEEDYGPFHDVSSACHKLSIMADGEPLELVWEDDRAIVQNQINVKNAQVVTCNEPNQLIEPEVALKCEGIATNPINFFHEDEAAPWFQHPLNGNLSQDFCWEPFKNMSIGTSNTLEREVPFSSNASKKSRIVKDAELLEAITQKRCDKSQPDQNPMLPPRPPQHAGNASILSKADVESEIVNFSNFFRPLKLNLRHSGCREVARNLKTKQKNHQRRGKPSILRPSKASSAFCGSNQIENRHPEPIHKLANVKPNQLIDKPAEGYHNKAGARGHKLILRDRATTTSPSAGSDAANSADRKRKGKDDEELEWQNEETELQSTEVEKPHRSIPRRSRAAQVHNLSERRRRDKINEKMKALQELIPHCNKTDKASMLDEAIEYLKSLQLQVQMMWMGNGMAPLMFPNIQHYLPSFTSTMPPIPGAVQMPRLPLGNQTVCPTSRLTTTGQFQSTYSHNIYPQGQNSGNPEAAFLRYLMLQNMRHSPEGIMKTFAPNASQPSMSNSRLLSSSSGSPTTESYP